MPGTKRGALIPESVTWTQMEPGSFEADRRIVRLDAMRIGWYSSSLGFKLEASLKPGTFIIGMLASHSTCARWFGAGVDERHVAATKESIRLSTAGPSAFLSVTVDARRLARDFPDSPDARTLLENARRRFARTQRPLCKAASLLSAMAVAGLHEIVGLPATRSSARYCAARSDSAAGRRAGRQQRHGRRAATIAEPPCRRSSSV